MENTWGKNSFVLPRNHRHNAHGLLSDKITKTVQENN